MWGELRCCVAAVAVAAVNAGCMWQGGCCCCCGNLCAWHSLAAAWQPNSTLDSTRLDSTLALSALRRPLTSDVKQNRRALIIWWQHTIQGAGMRRGVDRARHAVGAVETLGHGPWATLVGNFS